MVREKPAADFIGGDARCQRLNRSLRAISTGGLRDGELSLRQLRANLILSGFSPSRLFGSGIRITIIVDPPPVGEAEDSSTNTIVAVMATGRQIDKNGRVPATQERVQYRHRLLRPHFEQQLRIALSAISKAKPRKANPTWKMIDNDTIESDISKSGFEDRKAERRTIKGLCDKIRGSRIGSVRACWIRPGDMRKVMGALISALGYQRRTALATQAA